MRGRKKIVLFGLVTMLLLLGITSFTQARIERAGLLRISRADSSPVIGGFDAVNLYNTGEVISSPWIITNYVIAANMTDPVVGVVGGSDDSGSGNSTAELKPTPGDKDKTELIPLPGNDSDSDNGSGASIPQPYPVPPIPKPLPIIGDLENADTKPGFLNITHREISKASFFNHILDILTNFNFAETRKYYSNVSPIIGYEYPSISNLFISVCNTGVTTCN